MRKKVGVLPRVILFISAVILLIPVVYTITNSFMSPNEIRLYYGNMEIEGAVFHLFPDLLSLEGYYQILLRRPDFLIRFWNSVFLSSVIVVGQVVVSSLAGFAFSKYRFRGKEGWFFLTILLMMLPYQVTLVSNYIVLIRIGLVGSYASIIIPGIFSAFGVFLMRLVVDSVPTELVEAAMVEGAGHWRIFWKVILPNCKSGIAALLVLGFVDTWNMVEQPLVYLKDKNQYPLSIFLAQAGFDNLALSFSCGVLAMIPVLLLFLYFENELVEGISATNLR